MSQFSDSIESSLVLTVAGEKYSVPGGNIKLCRLALKTTGFNGEVEFWLSDEYGSGKKLTKDFASEQLIELQLSIKQYTCSLSSTQESISLTALVGRRSVYEQQYIELKDNKILYRKYWCEFSDAAQFLWRQHFPCLLYVNKSFGELIKDQQVNKISIKFDWSMLDDEKSMICLGLGATRLCFYDFLLGYLAQNGVFWLYNYSSNDYAIRARKVTPERRLSFMPNHIYGLKLSYGIPDVKTQYLLNGHSNISSMTRLKRNPLVEGIVNHHLIITPFCKVQQQQRNLQLKLAEPILGRLELGFKGFPLMVVVPGRGLKFDHFGFSHEGLNHKQSYRSISCDILLTAIEQQGQHDLNQVFTQYQGHYHCHFEHENDISAGPDCPLSPPCYVEGIIVSENGEEADKTYQHHSNKTSEQKEYCIDIPLWGKKIKLLSKPDFMPPHFYFPLYKGCRVLLEMDLFSAQICRVLDFGGGVFLNDKTQGNHLLFGKNGQDETSLSHVYEDGKPELVIKRKKMNDTEMVKLEEGKITFQTKQEDDS
ncbi:MAG: hypothetical protein RPU51_11540 [Candidatus Sedimenticola sp. (ex Thyasira tokunagai)]